MSGTALITFCFDKNFNSPGLFKSLSFLLNNHAERVFCLEYYENGLKKKGFNIDLKLFNNNLPQDTFDYFIMYDWVKPEGLIPEAANEINNYFVSTESDPFKLFDFSFLSGVCISSENEVFEEVKDFASRFLICFYAETNTVIYDSVNFENNLRNNPKVQDLIQAFENEFKTKVIKIGVSVSI